MLEGNLRLVRGEPAAAEGYYRRARHLLESALGPDDREVAHLLNNLGVALEDQQEWDSATKTHPPGARDPPPDHGPRPPRGRPGPVQSRSSRAQSGHAGVAGPLLKPFLAIRSTTLGREHPWVAAALGVLARAEVKLGFVDSAGDAGAEPWRSSRRGSDVTTRRSRDAARARDAPAQSEPTREALHLVELAAPTLTSTPEVPEGDRLPLAHVPVELLAQLSRLDDARQRSRLGGAHHTPRADLGPHGARAHRRGGAPGRPLPAGGLRECSRLADDTSPAHTLDDQINPANG